MTDHHITVGLTLTIGGDEAEVELDVAVGYTPGAPEHYAKDPGMWLPADPPEAELTSAKVRIDQHLEGGGTTKDVPDWLFNTLAEMDWIEILDTEDAP